MVIRTRRVVVGCASASTGAIAATRIEAEGDN